MRRRFAAVMFPVMLCCIFYGAKCAASAGEVKFGTGVSKDWQLINEAREFDTNLITCGFYSQKPFGVMQVVISIYLQEKPDARESVLNRVSLEVNPEWDVMILPELPLPGVGKYTFTLSTLAGATLATGDVIISEKKVEATMPEQPKIDGTSLEKLFNKFKPN